MTNGEKIKEIFPNGIYPSSGTWMCMEYKEPTIKNDSVVDCIDRAELLKAMDTWDKFGYLANHGLIRLGKENKYYVQYVRYEDMVNCVKGMSSVTPQEPRKGHWIKSRDSYGNNHFTCPFCEHDIATKADTWGDNYCSNCGADMREVEE